MVDFSKIRRYSFGGLTRSYYVRKYLFGLAIGLGVIFANYEDGNGGVIASVILAAVYTLLFPYARFVYETIVEYILGDTVLFANVQLFFILKIFTYLLCWVLAFAIAPIGLVWLYFANRRLIEQPDAD